MALGFALFAGVPSVAIGAAAREAETLGYSSFWVNHPGPTDGLASLAAAAKETRRIELGIGVIPLHTRGPASIIDGVRTQALPLDRLLLGVGSPNPGALVRVRGGIAELRSRLGGASRGGSSGEASGEMVRGPRLVIAALGPKMCRLAGEVGDGVLLNWVSPEHARRSAELVREGAVAAQRPVPKIFAYVRLAVGPGAHERVLAEANRYAGVPAYGANFERMGVKPETTAIAVSTPQDVAPALSRWRGVVDEVVLRAVPAADTGDEILALVRAARP